MENKIIFKDLIKGEKSIALFYADWCGPCQMFKPVFESTSQKNNFVNGLFNVDENQELSTEQRIQGIPTAIIFKDGQEVDRRSGFMSADDFKSWVESK